MCIKVNELKYPSKETIKRLTTELRLEGANKYTQDWDKTPPQQDSR